MLHNSGDGLPAASAQVFLSRAQVEAPIGLRPGGLMTAKLPPPDAIIGPVKGWVAAAGHDARLATRNDRPLETDPPRAELPHGRSEATVGRLADAAPVEHNGPIPGPERRVALNSRGADAVGWCGEDALR